MYVEHRNQAILGTVFHARPSGSHDRIIVWWLVLAAAIGLPIYCFVPGNVMPDLRLPAALLLGALMTVSNIMLGQAIRWMDQHSAWANAKPTKQTAV